MQVRLINAKLAVHSPELIVHALRELDEKLGTLVILVIKVCFSHTSAHECTRVHTSAHDCT